jgi:DNA repair ATPase RecN
LKVHHFDLANQIKDVELMAQTTKDNLRRSVRKLNLRKKYEGTPKLSPSFDVKIWKYEIKTQLSDLQTQLEKANAIIKVLEKLQKDCARTADNLNNTLLSLKEQLKKKIEAGKVKVADL